MTIADVLAVLAALGLAGTGLPALVSLLHLLVPGVTERSSDALSRHPIGSFALGFLAAIAILVVVTVSSNVLAGPGKLVGVLALASGFGAVVLGWTGLSILVGRRLAERTGRSHTVPDVLAGSILVEFACVIPILGWLFVLPIVLLMALGAGVRALLPRARRTVVAAHAVGLGFDPRAEV
jgi:hypothetical protein